MPPRRTPAAQPATPEARTRKALPPITRDTAAYTELKAMLHRRYDDWAAAAQG